jgi:hypothetical protein
MRTLLTFAASCVLVAAANATDLPFRLATSSEVSSLTQSGVIATSLDQTEFNTAALVTVQKLSSNAVNRVQRAHKALSGVYKAAISAGTDPNPHPVPPAVQPTDLVDYEVNHDAVQAWASMSELGAPFVMVYVDGKSKGQSAASWSTQYVVPGSGDRDVYAQFTVPEVKFGGRFEDSVPSLSWARMRIDFLVDAYPAWSTEAVRFNETYVYVDPATQAKAIREKAVHIDTFGYSVGLDAAHPNSVSRKITIKLGTYPAGKVFDLTALFQVEGKVDTACDETDGETECGGVSVKVEWDPSAPQPTLYSKPVP